MEGLVAQAEGRKGLPDQTQKEAIGHALVVVDQGPQGLGQGEGQQVVVDRQALGALALDPGLAGFVLALRTEAMTTGEGEDLVVVAVVAVDGGAAAGLGAAALDGGQGLAMTGQQAGAILGLQFRQEGADDLGQADHAASFQGRTKPFRSCP